MDIDKLSILMDKFEQQFEDLDVKTGYMESTMNATTGSSTPAEQVDEVVADANNLKLGHRWSISQVGPLSKKQPMVVAQQPKPEDAVTNDLESRLANLRN